MVSAISVQQRETDSRPIAGDPKLAVDQRLDGLGVSKIDPLDPAAPQYLMLAKMRSPVTLRELMIKPVRTGYIGQDHPIDPNELPPTAAQLYPRITVSEIFVPSPAGPVRCQVFADSRAAGARPMMLYFHGGGFTVGQSEDTAYIASRIAAENGTVVVGVNYRLAPEWPFPAGLDDCIAVLRWMRGQGSEIGGDSSWIAVAGDSSGGNFAAAMPLKARDSGVKPPDAVISLCPITDFFSRTTPHLNVWVRLASFMIPHLSASYGEPMRSTIRTGLTLTSARREAICADIHPR